MTIVVTVKVTDGIVLSSDSATSFIAPDGTVAKIYNNANKIFNLVKGLPIGSLTYGSGSIGSASIATISKDLRRKLTVGSGDVDYELDPATYTIQEVAEKAKKFFLELYTAAYPVPVPNFGLGYRVCGYSANAALPECWEIQIKSTLAEGPTQIYGDGYYGPRWAGETEALNRLILGIDGSAANVLEQAGVDPAIAFNTINEIIEGVRSQLFLTAMPIQDAIDLAKYLVDTTVGYSHFSLKPATVGGPVEIATITKHEGFKWVCRKHYFSSDYNRDSFNVT